MSAVVALSLRLPSHLPSVLCFLIGAWLLYRQPIRQRAQAWACAADLIWLQGLSSAFSLGPEHQGVNQVQSDPLFIRPAVLAHAHRLAAALAAPRQGSMERQDLTDLLTLISKRRDQLHSALVHHGLIKRLITVSLLALISVGAVALFFKDSNLADALFLGIATIVVCLWLSRPLPLVMQDRLAEAVAELDQAGNRLLCFIEETSILTDSVRRQVEDLLLKLGEHVVDLCMEGQRAVRARRRWLP